jgi:hypothetical protein
MKEWDILNIDAFLVIIRGKKMRLVLSLIHSFVFVAATRSLYLYVLHVCACIVYRYAQSTIARSDKEEYDTTAGTGAARSR